MQDYFRYFKLGAASRMALAAGLFAVGIALELSLKASPLPGFLVLMAGWLPLMLKKATNKPDDQGLEEWRPVPMSEVDRLDDGIRASIKLRAKTISWSAGVGLGLGVPALIASLFASMATGRSDIAFVAANVAALFVPALLFGRIKVFTPGTIAMKMPSFRAALSVRLPEGVNVSPYIRFDKDASGGDVPEDLRFMIELKRPPADLVGIQVQAAINKGPNGAVPYLYAVVLTKGKAGPSYRTARGARIDGFEVEPGGEGEYGTVVIRQSTEGGGYYTSPDDCRELVGACAALLQRIKAA